MVNKGRWVVEHGPTVDEDLSPRRGSADELTDPTRLKDHMQNAITTVVARRGLGAARSLVKQAKEIRPDFRLSSRGARDMGILGSTSDHFAKRRAARRLAREFVVGLEPALLFGVQQFLGGVYEPVAPKAEYLPKVDASAFEDHMMRLGPDDPPSGRFARVVWNYRLPDRLILGTIWEAVRPVLEDPLTDFCVGGVSNRPISQTVHQAKRHVAQAQADHGRYFWATLDIRNCFPSVPIEALVEVLGRYFHGPIVEGLQLLAAAHEESKEQGIPQGNPLSPAFLNLLLHDRVDRHLTSSPGLRFWRYLDDITIVGPTKETVEDALAQATNLITAAGFEIHPEKYTGVISGGPIRMLGVLVEPERISLSRDAVRRCRELRGRQLLGSLRYYRSVLTRSAFCSQFHDLADFLLDPVHDVDCLQLLLDMVTKASLAGDWTPTEDGCLILQESHLNLAASRANAGRLA